MSWSSRRQARLILLVLGLCAAVAIIPVYLFFNRAPTCFDGKQNNGESGVDCGGACRYLCAFEAQSLVYVWQRAFKASEGIYNAVAVVENHNTGAGVREITYSFKLYDDRNILITERKGTMSVPPRISIPVFESNIFTGKRIPVRTTFLFTGEALWEYMDPKENVLTVSNQVLTDKERTPRLDARIENTSIRAVEDVQVIAVIYDGAENAMAVSATTVDRIEKDSIAEVAFTWNEPFPDEVAKIDIVPQIRL